MSNESKRNDRITIIKSDPSATLNRQLPPTTTNTPMPTVKPVKQEKSDGIKTS